MNVPLKGGTKTPLFHTKFKQEVITKLKEFKPELIMLSAGFDAHKDDPIRSGEAKVGLSLNEADYTRLTRRLLKVAERHAGGRVISVLEGGYDVSAGTNALQSSFKAHTLALLNFKRVVPQKEPPIKKEEAAAGSIPQDASQLPQKPVVTTPRASPLSPPHVVNPVRKLTSPGEMVILVKQTTDEADEVDVDN